MSSSSVEYLLFKQFILIVVIGFLYSLSHDLLQLETIKTVPLKRAVVDNITHISLGIISWLVVISHDDKICHSGNIASSLLCGFFAGFVDIDHFIMAKSFNLNDVMNLPSRPLFHNTTLMLISILSFILIMYTTGCLKLSYIGWILLVAVISHHLRDSLHRGIWLWPVNLKPIKQFPCLILTYCVPLFIGYIVNFIYGSHNHLLNYDYFIV